uniref:ORF50d n=1 Tax=Pinus koraiensis TaxID=88728 RepID=A4QMK3_PINKO|nr:ORF50d [Pinus koraiensis]
MLDLFHHYLFMQRLVIVVLYKVHSIRFPRDREKNIWFIYYREKMRMNTIG